MHGLSWRGFESSVVDCVGYLHHYVEPLNFLVFTVVGHQLLLSFISFVKGFKIEEPDKNNKPGLHCIQFTDIHDSNKKYALKAINGIRLVFEVS